MLTPIEEQIDSLEKQVISTLNKIKNKEKSVLARLKNIPPYHEGVLTISLYNVAKELEIPEEEINEVLAFGKRPEELEEIKKYHNNGQ